jgi:ABC-type amino acid transport substrate-binding protein
MSWAGGSLRAVVAGLAVVAVAGCSTAEDERAREAADDFYAAVEARDGAAACALLTSTTREELQRSAESPCDQAILGEDLPTVTEAERVKVYDTMAQVRYAEETVFLTRIADNWRVLAVSCTRRPGEQPYDCQVKGG